MKLSNLAAKLTCIKRDVVRTLAVAAIAGAALTAAAPAAGAQQFAVGVRFGHPRYIAPPPPRPYFPGYEGYRYDGGYNGWRARQDFVRHEDWARFHHERAYGYPRY